MGTRSDSANVSPGSGIRARAERVVRCGRPKNEDGRPCRRSAGRDTDHFGEGPCSFHDDGTWQRITFAEDESAQQAFLEAVRTRSGCGIRDLIEPLGYHRRDVVALAASSREFDERYVEARGYDPDTIRNELKRRAIDGGSDRLLEFLAKLNLPEAEKLRQSHIDGRVDVSVQHVLDVGRLSEDELTELKRLLAKATPQEQLDRAQRPALELVSGE